MKCLGERGVCTKGQSLGFHRCGWVPQHKNNRVPSYEHLWNISVLIYWLGLLPALACLGRLRPHLLGILQDHVKVTVESLHTRQQLPVVPAVDEHLRIVFNCLREHGERSCLEFFLFFLAEVLFRHLALGFAADRDTRSKSYLRSVQLMHTCQKYSH